mgnify:CR=1 FL=1
MNKLALGIGIGVGALAIGGGIAFFATRGDKGEALADTPTDAFASSTVRDFDRLSRNGNFSGAVEVASEGTRLIHDHSTKSYSSGSRPTSGMTGLPTGSKQGGYYHYSYDATFDGASLWKAADAATGGDGSVTPAELTTFLQSAFAGDDGTIDVAEQQRLFDAHPGAFTAAVTRAGR